MNILNSINDLSTDETSHATSVAFISSAIAKKLNWHSKGTAYKLYLAAILHDVGKKNLPKDLLDKSVSLMTREEFEKYKAHVNIGKDILIEQRSIPSDVVKAVYEHHEYYNGTGFPNGLKRDFIHPFARVIRIADDFCRYSYPPGEEPRDLDEVLKIMRELKSLEYDLFFFLAFLKIFKKSG